MTFVRFDIFSIFPSMFDSVLGESILKRAQESGLVEIHVHDIREWTTDRHRSVDDYPYGGGPGMVMMAPPIVEAVESVLPDGHDDTEVIVLSPSGALFNQQMAVDLVSRSRIALICGRYEGIDQRVVELLDAREVSIGDFVLTGGELPAAVIVDAVTRLIPGVIQEESSADESHSAGLLEYPHYTRPYEYRGLTPPDVLLSGHHANVEAWRREQALERTRLRRPDLLEQRNTESTARVDQVEHSRARSSVKRSDSRCEQSLGTGPVD
jgi:tRNA (guanine37-N1)-methyltransferase